MGHSQQNTIIQTFKTGKTMLWSFYGYIAYVAKKDIKMWMGLIKSECMNMLPTGEGGSWGEEKIPEGHTGGLDTVSVICHFF